MLVVSDLIGLIFNVIKSLFHKFPEVLKMLIITKLFRIEIALLLG
jgi:hypothetical protein